LALLLATLPTERTVSARGYGHKATATWGQYQLPLDSYS